MQSARSCPPCQQNELEQLQQQNLFQLTEIKRQLAEKSLFEYIKQAWPVIEPSTAYLHNWHIELIAEYLEAITFGQIKRLVINIPPRHMKSILVSVMWPTWEWIHDSTMRWVFASYSLTLSVKHNVDRRNILQSDWYLQNWGDRFHLAAEQNVKSYFSNDKRGHMIAVSTTSCATGLGGNRIVLDDPHSATEALSDTQRQAAIDFYDFVLSTRLDDKRSGAIVVIMQRLHERDMTGHLLQQGSWEHVCIPCIANKPQVITMPTSRKAIVREEGDLIWPEREGPAEIALAKVTLGTYGFSGQYQQRPAPAEGGIFKRYWWRYWCFPGQQLPPVTEKDADGNLINIEAMPLPNIAWDQLAQSWDMAFKDAKTSSYVVGQVWGRVGADCYLLDQVRDKLDFVQTVQAVKVLSAKWPKVITKLIEDTANGPAVISSLRQKIPGLVAVRPDGSKESRAHAISPLVESGNVYLPHPAIAPWINDYIEEMTAFPNAMHSDQCDATTQALSRLHKQQRTIVSEDIFNQTALKQRSKWASF